MVDQSSIIKNRLQGSIIGYSRVSFPLQQEELQRQEESIKDRYPACQIILTDIGSSLDYNRPGLKTLLSRVEKGHISTVVVTHRDRLCRFGLELIQRIFRLHHTKLVVLSDQDQDQIQSSSDQYSELTDDLLGICNYFATKRTDRQTSKYGRESDKNPKVPIISEQRDHQNPGPLVSYNPLGL